MAESINTITDKSKFKEIFENNFAQHDAFIKTKSGNLKIHFLGYSGDQVAFRIPHVKNSPESIVIFTRITGVTIYVNLKYVENTEDTFIFVPLKIQMLNEARKEERVQISNDDKGKLIIYMNNIVQDFAIKTEFNNNEKKVDSIREIAYTDLKKHFNEVSIFLISDGKLDNRYTYLVNGNDPIYIPDLKGKLEGMDEMKFRSYHYNILSKDLQLLSRKDLLSEISVLIKYRNIIPYGYIQVNLKEHCSKSHFAYVTRMSMIFDDLIRKNNVLSPINEKFLVSDISRNGLGVVFKDRRLSKHFRMNSLTVFDVFLPNGQICTVGAIVRNINFLETSIMKVGFQIKAFDHLTMKNYMDFLDVMGIKEAPVKNKHEDDEKEAASSEADNENVEENLSQDNPEKQVELDDPTDPK